MCSQAVLAAIDSRDNGAPQLKRCLVYARLSNDVHAQTKLDLSEIIAQPALCAVGHVIHSHHRGGAESCVNCLFAEVLAGFLKNLLQDQIITGGGRGSDQAAPQLLLIQLGRTRERTDVELLILGIRRKCGLQVVDGH